MSDEHKGDGPAPELAPVVDDYIPTAAELAVIDPNDGHEIFLRMDDHDVRMLLSQVQTAALKVWVYVLPDGAKGLSVGGVEDIVQRLNWTGKARIGLVPETLTVEQIMADEGNGEEPFWSATVFSRDEVTGQTLAGSSMEPQWMKLRPATAQRKRQKGATIGEDNRIFDRFSRTKAIQKASRNALEAHIPEEIKQTVIAMFAKDPTRVERIRTEAEQKMLDRPPALTDDEAKDKIAQAKAMYDEIRELGGAAVVEFPPGKFGAYLLNAQHSQESLDALLDYVAGERDRLREKYGVAA